MTAFGCAKDDLEFKGHVVDGAGKPIPDVLVKLVQIADNPALTAPVDYATTDGNGDFEFPDVECSGRSRFFLVVSKKGYEPDAQEVSLGATNDRKRKELDEFVLNESAR
jgi:hypothetical protein